MTRGANLDRERVETMSEKFLAIISANYVVGPPGRDRVFEALNALAFAASGVIAGTGSREGRRESRAFFDRALDDNVALLVREKVAGNG